jgi:lysophospholipase L1-like esterase
MGDNNNNNIDRREFLFTSAFITASACSSGERGHITSPPDTPSDSTPDTPSDSEPSDPPATPAYVLPNGGTVLFQGDSITDSDHWPGTIYPNNARAMGCGYAMFVAQQLLYAYPKKQLLCYNRARGGDTVPLLQARWQTDALDLKPDLLSILIGINDYAADYENPKIADIYEENYTKLVDDTRKALPNVQFVILEPYVMADVPTTPFQVIRDAAKRVAKHVDAIFVPLQDMLDQHAREETRTYWIADQAHPTIAGSAAIAKQWLKYVGL